jgi:transposase
MVFPRLKIAEGLHVGHGRIDRIIHEWESTGQIQDAKPRGRPRTVTLPIQEFIDVRTIQDTHLSCQAFSAQIAERFHPPVSTRTVDRYPRPMHFHYQPAQHSQSLTKEHKQRRILLCNEILEYPIDVVEKIVCFDESRIGLGDDKRWVWYRRGEDNPSATRTTAKYPPLLMAFVVIMVGFKPKHLIIEWTINAETYRRNIETLVFMDELNQLHGTLQWIFQQDEGPAHTAGSTMAWLGHICTVLAR